MSSDRIKLDQLIGCSVFNKFSKTSRHYTGVHDLLELRGFYPAIEHWRDGKLFDVYQIDNDIVNEGKNLILETFFKDGTQIPSTSWYLGLVSVTGYTAFANTDTMASHSGWTEFIGYTQGTRVAWGPGTPAAQSITNATPATFDINTGGTLKGIFVTSNNTKSGTAGKLWATGPFSADVPVVNGDQMKITYTVSS